MLVWLSIDTWLITLVSVAFLIALFLVAYWGDKKQNVKWANSSTIYSLSLGMSCTTWAFYGTVGQASITGQWIAPIYIGTIGFFILAWPVLLKILRVSKQLNLTSIADFIASRYENTPRIAALVSIIALIGTIPYIALQLRAISHSFDLVTGSYQSGSMTTFAVTTVLIVFSILFGARDSNINKQNPGLVLAIAFSSVIKLFIFLTIGMYVTYGLFGGFGELLSQTEHVITQSNEQTLYLTLSQIALGAISIFITPQLYHMIVIENHQEKHLASARWQYPLYLVLINIFVLPIAIAGQLTFPGGSVNADTYVLTLPLFHQNQWLSGLVFVGGLAAAVSMVVVAAIVLSTMIATEIVTPLIVKKNQSDHKLQSEVAPILLLFRRFSIAIILLLGFIFERLVSHQSHLSNLGILSFVLLAQAAPALIAALYWRKASSIGALTGLITGTVVWVYTLLIPMLLPGSDIVMTGPWGISWLNPTQLFGLDNLDLITHGTLLSLTFNILALVVISLNVPKTVGEKLQAELYLKKQGQFINYTLSLADVFHLLSRFIDKQTADTVFNNFNVTPTNQRAPKALIEEAQKALSNVLGSASTKLVMKAATESPDHQMSLDSVAGIVDEANQLFVFNRELLQAAVENIEQGISVVDADMRLVAWNKRYIELLNYPNGFLKAGMHIRELLTFNVERGFIIGENIDSLVDRRIQHMQAGRDHYYQRILPSGVVLEIRGQAMPGGGFVSTFSDITKHIETERALQRANEVLEQRVQERTKELAAAKLEAEAANTSKTRFLAAASHDLMQPFNALSLFTDMLKQQVEGQPTENLAQQIQQSLTSVEALLSDLVEISKLDGFSQQVQLEPVKLDDVLSSLVAEINALAYEKNITFHYVPSSVSVVTDKRLLRRVIQNLLANALNYAPLSNRVNTKVLLGVRRKSHSVRVCILDNGPGIPNDKQSLIFKEFERLEANSDTNGLGLGLAICDRICKLLNHALQLQSVEGEGAMFSVTMPVSEHAVESTPAIKDKRSSLNLKDQELIVIDNDTLLLSALTEQLTQWQCKVNAYTGRKQWLEQGGKRQNPVVIIADYHLDDGDNGIALAQHIISQLNIEVPCIICSADPSDTVRQDCIDAGFAFVKKPIKSLALKKLIKQLID